MRPQQVGVDVVVIQDRRLARVRGEGERQALLLVRPRRALFFDVRLLLGDELLLRRSHGRQRSAIQRQLLLLEEALAFGEGVFDIVAGSGIARLLGQRWLCRRFPGAVSGASGPCGPSGLGRRMHPVVVLSAVATMSVRTRGRTRAFMAPP